MRLQEVGGRSLSDEKYLLHAWHRSLNPAQLEAYIRYLFIALKTKNYDYTSSEHTTIRRKWDGGINNFGTRFKRVWNKIAKGIQHCNAHPGMWVAAHFSPAFHAVRVAENKGFIDNRPELLVNKLSPDVYEKYLASFDELTLSRCRSAEVSVATQLTLLDSVIKDEDDRVFYIVADGTNVNATPFFRHAFAALADCRRGISRYILPAVIEYDMNQPLYDALVSRQENSWWVSDEMRQLLISHREYWSTQNV